MVDLPPHPEADGGMDREGYEGEGARTGAIYSFEYSISGNKKLPNWVF